MLLIMFACMQHRIVNSSNTSAFDVVVSHEGPSSDFSFTLAVYSNDKVQIRDGDPALSYSASVRNFDPIFSTTDC